jgi:hypothetical protein
VKARERSVNWAGIRDEYVTGDETFKQIAARISCSIKTVEAHSQDREKNGGRTWPEWRAEFRDEVAGKSTEITKLIRVEAAAKVAMRQASYLADLAEQAQANVENAFAECDPKDRIALSLKVIELERKVHGLDRAPVKVELTGKDGGPVEHTTPVGFGVDPAAVARAERALEALFGSDADSPRADRAS